MTEIRKARLRLLLRLVLIVTLCFIWGNSMQNKAESANISGGVTGWLWSIGIPVTDHIVRKTAHFCEFGLLGCELMLLFWLRNGLRFQNLCNSAFAALLSAVTDESIQLFVGRDGMVQDVVLDFTGAVTGILLVSLVIHLIEKQKKLTSEPEASFFMQRLLFTSSVPAGRSAGKRR